MSSLNVQPKRQDSKKRGFSLPEVLVYIAVLVLIAGAAVNTFFSLSDVLLRNQTERRLSETAQMTLEYIVREIRNAETADVTIPQTLGLSSFGSPTTTSIQKQWNNEVTVHKNGSYYGNLTPETGVILEDIQFSRYEELGAEVETQLVRVALTLSYNTKAASTTRTYYTSAVLRRSYE